MSALVAAMLLDAALGEPRWLWARLPHPAVLMGRAVEALDRQMNHGGNRVAKGIAALALMVAGAALAGAAIGALGWVAETIAAAILLAHRSLVQHLAAVAAGLRMSLSEGRRAVALIVGRDTEAMDGPAIARAAIESGAENFSDGVIAPLFWFAVAGLPGMAVYKIVNTADSMIGHRTQRHEAFGWAAARLDDLLNLIPARLTAALLALSHGITAAGPIARDARQHRSPNAGWPEAAMAHVLNVALSGPRSYHGELRDFPFVHPAGARDPGAAEIDAAIAALWRAWRVALAAAFLLALAC